MSAGAAILAMIVAGGAAGPFPGQLLDRPLDPGVLVSPAWLQVASASAGRPELYASSAAADPSLACAAGLLFPGLGHAFIGHYLYRGLAFTSSFLATVLGSIAFLVQAEANPAVQDSLIAGGVTLMALAEILWVWSAVDAMRLATMPPDRRAAPAIRLGVD